MDSVDILNRQIEELQKQMRIIKKMTMEKEDFLHSGELRLMKFIAYHENELGKSPTPSTVSDMVGVSQATISAVADRLIKKELLSKEINNQDKRSKVISLTDKGKKALKGNHKRFMEMLSAMSYSLGDEDTKELIRILDKINYYFEGMKKEDLHENKCK